MALQHDFEGTASRNTLIARLFRLLSRRIFFNTMSRKGLPANDNAKLSEAGLSSKRAKRPILKQRFIFIDGKFSHCEWEREK
jgi:hypothetical protein